MKLAVQDHAGPVRRFFQKWLRGEVDDLVQQTMLAGLEARGRFRGEAQYGTFLLQIARNLLHARYREIARERTLYTLVQDDESPPREAEEHLGTGSTERMESALNDALSKLDPDLQSVLVLAYWGQLARDQIAQRLGVPPGTVASRLRRARACLRDALREEGLE